MSSLRQSYGRIANPTKVPLAQPLTDNGAAGGDNDMTVDGSITPVDFYYQPGPNERSILYEFTIQIGDAGNTTEDDYGSISGPLANGIQFYSVIDGIETPLGSPVTHAAQYFARGASVAFTELSGNKRVADYSFSFFGISDGVILDGRTSDKYLARINDNLSSLPIHSMSVGGHMQIIAGS